VFTAFYSTGIPNIEVFAALRKRFAVSWRGHLYPSVIQVAAVRSFFRRGMRAGSTPTSRPGPHPRMGEVEDAHGRKAAARLHGPEAGVIWTSLAALRQCGNTCC